MNRKTIIKQIRRKFYSCVWFSTTTGIRLTRLRSYLAGKLSDQTAMAFEMELYEAMKQEFNHPLYITQTQREHIRQRIAINYVTRRAFCQRHKKFNEVWVSNIINGRKKRKDQKYNELLRVLG